MEMHSPELKARRGAGKRGIPGQTAGLHKGSVAGKEDENQAWLDMLEKATSSVRYISRHIKKEHFIREVASVECFSPTRLLLAKSHIVFVRVFCCFRSRLVFLPPSLLVSPPHPGRPRLEVCGAGDGQDFPLGLSHRVNTGNCPHLHSRTADVPQHTLRNNTTRTKHVSPPPCWFRNKLYICTLKIYLPVCDDFNCYVVDATCRSSSGAACTRVQGSEKQ